MASISLNQARFDFASSSENVDSPNRLNSPMSSGHSTPIASSISTPIQAVKKGPNRGKKFYGSWKADNCHYFVWEHKDEKVDLLIWKQEKKTLLTEIESLIADLKRIKEDKKMLEEKKAKLKLKKEKMKVEVEKTTKS